MGGWRCPGGSAQGSRKLSDGPTLASSDRIGSPGQGVPPTPWSVWLCLEGVDFSSPTPLGRVFDWSCGLAHTLKVFQIFWLAWAYASALFWPVLADSPRPHGLLLAGGNGGLRWICIILHSYSFSRKSVTISVQIMSMSKNRSFHVYNLNDVWMSWGCSLSMDICNWATCALGKLLDSRFKW